MNTDKQGFDEMQKAKRDKIGNQTLNLMFYLIFIDVILYSFGLRWLEYPSNIMVITMISASVYVIRTIAVDAFMPVKSQRPKAGKRMMIVIVVTLLVAVVSAILLSSFDIFHVETESGDNSALVLLIVSLLGLAISAVFSLVKGISDKKSGDNE